MDDLSQFTELRLLGFLDTINDIYGECNEELTARLESVLEEASREPLLLCLDERDRVALRRFIRDTARDDIEKAIEITMGFELGYRYALLYGKLRRRKGKGR